MMRSRNNQVTFHYGPKEKAAYEEFRKDSKIPFGLFMRTMCDVIPVQRCPVIDYGKHLAELRSVGGRLNSIASAYHTNRIFNPDEIRDAYREFERVLNSLRDEINAELIRLGREPMKAKRY